MALNYMLPKFNTFRMKEPKPINQSSPHLLINFRINGNQSQISGNQSQKSK
jgi:hypothetical protein